MADLKNLVFCLTLVVCLGAIKAQRCTPGVVPNITVSTTNQVRWEAALNPNSCKISAYVINIFDLEDGSQLQYETSNTVLYYSLAILDMCTTYAFEVHALTDQNVLGPSDRVNGTTPPATNLNLSLHVNNATLNDSQLGFTWNPIATGVAKCVSYYRVVYWDENNDPTDVYVPTTSFVLPETPVPCMEYKFQVSAIVSNPDTEGPLTEINWDEYTAVATPPKLVSIVTSNSTVNMTWQLPSYSETRCELTFLVVNTLGLPTNTSSSRFAILDSALRTNVGAFLQDLTPDTVYTSYVSLQNSAGYSKNVTVTYQTSDAFVFSYDRDLYYD